MIKEILKNIENKVLLKETSHEIHEPKIMNKYDEPEIVKVIKKLFEGYKGFTCTKIQAVGENQYYNIDVRYDLDETEQGSLEDKRYLLSQAMQKFRLDFFSDISRYYPVINANVSGYKAEKNANTIEFYVTLLLSNTNKRDWSNGEFYKGDKRAKDILPKEKIKESVEKDFKAGSTVYHKEFGKGKIIPDKHQYCRKTEVLVKFEKPLPAKYHGYSEDTDCFRKSELSKESLDEEKRLTKNIKKDTMNLIEKYSLKNILFNLETQAIFTEGRNAKIDKKYTHFAIDRKTGKIIDGWQYKDLDPEDIVHYAKGDLKARDIPFSSVKISTKKTLMNKGINPYEKSNWGNSYNTESDEKLTESENCILPDGSGFSTMTTKKLKEASRANLKFKGKRRIFEDDDLTNENDGVELTHGEKMQVSKLAKQHISNQKKYEELQEEINRLEREQEKFLNDEINQKIIDILEKTKDKMYKSGKLFVKVEKLITYKNFKAQPKYAEVVKQLTALCQIEKSLVDKVKEACTERKEPVQNIEYKLDIKNESKQLKENFNAKKIFARLKNLFFPIYKKYSDAITKLEIILNNY